MIKIIRDFDVLCLFFSDGSKISKRNEGLTVEHFRARGYSSDSVVKWLCASSSGFESHRDTILKLQPNEFHLHVSFPLNFEMILSLAFYVSWIFSDFSLTWSA